MNRWPRSLLLAGAVLLCQACAGTLPSARDGTGEAGLRAYIEPATGTFTAPPPGAAAPTDARASTSSEGLVESQGTSAAGGMRLDLKGKFRSYAIATKDETGRVTVRCEPSAPQTAP